MSYKFDFAFLADRWPDFVAGAWLFFLLAWGSLAKKAGRFNAERVWRTGRWSLRPPSSSS